MEKIRAKIRWIIYQKESFYILDLSDGTKAKGNIYDNMNGDIRGLEYSFKGEWITDKYGKTFKFEEAEMEDNNVYFFLTSIVKGIGESYASQMIERFGDDIEEIIDKTPWKLSQIPGIGKKRIEKIVQSWKEHSHMRKLSDYLNNTGVNPSIITKIFETYREESVKLLERNPYIITKINGITFPVADMIAKKNGFDMTSDERISAGIEYIFRTIAYDRGDTWLKEDELVKFSFKVLNLSFDNKDIIEKVIEKSHEIFTHESKIALNDIYMWEKSVHRFFETNYRLSIFSEKEIKNYITEYENENRIELSIEQKNAVLCSVNHKISALTGYAGTGKTTVSKLILEILSRKFGENITGCAMSGIAARRLQDLTGFPCYTIHSLLGFDGNDFSFNQFNPLPYDVVILDEAGMVNSELMKCLINSFLPQTIFIMIGDDAQLPPIGPGNVFSDIIRNELVPFIKLQKIFRQDEDSVVNIYANEIRHTRIPESFDKPHSDWYFKDISFNCDEYPCFDYSNPRQENNIRILNYIKKTCSDYYSKGIENRFTGIQILSPQKKGILGTENLNIQLSDIFNPRNIISEKNRISRNNKIFAVGDKVVHLKNIERTIWEDIWDWENNIAGSSTTRRIFNGTLGIIEKIRNGNVYVRSILDEIIEYSVMELDDIIDLAYALTIHKSQGSEFEIVIIPLTSSQKIMLDNQLMYTAITRAKKGLILCGEKEAFRYSCMNDSKKFRNTWLPYLHNLS